MPCVMKFVLPAGMESVFIYLWRIVCSRTKLFVRYSSPMTNFGPQNLLQVFLEQQSLGTSSSSVFGHFFIKAFEN